MKKPIRVFALVLALFTCFFAYGCSRPSEDEVLSAYKELYPKAFAILQIAYGEGLPCEKEGIDLDSISSPHYVKVSAESPYKTQAELENAVLSVFTEGFYNDVLKAVLFGGVQSDENGLFGLIPRYKETGGELYIDILYSGGIKLYERDLTQASVKKVKTKSAVVEAPYTVNGVEKIKETTVVLTENGWRFDEMV